jgi:hypothetical protein
VARQEQDRGREPVKVGGRGGGSRARSVSVAPQGGRTGFTSSADSAAAVGGRRSSRARSVTRGARPYRGSEVGQSLLYISSPGTGSKFPTFCHRFAKMRYISSAGTRIC